MKHILNLIEDYRKMKGTKLVLKTLVLPTIATGLILFASESSKISSSWAETQSLLVSVLGILLGFMVSATAIVATSNNENVRKSKDFKIDVRSRDREKYLYDELIAESVWTTICCASSVLMLIVVPLILDSGKIMMPLGIWLTVYCIRCAAGMVLDLYMIFSASED